jgi:hypothetical protein
MLGASRPGTWQGGKIGNDQLSAGNAVGDVALFGAALPAVTKTG